MSWSTVPESPDCPPESPWGVVNDETGVLVPNGCYADEGAANERVAALYAEEVGLPVEGSASDPVLAAVYNAWERSSANPGGKSFAVSPMAPAASGMPMPTAMPMFDPALFACGHWRGVLVVEGVETGDSPRREFAEGSVSFRQPPLSIYWQKVTDEGHDNAFIVARADEVWRADDIKLADGRVVSGLRARGQFNLAQPEGVEAYQLVGDRFFRGVSVTVSETQDSDVEYVMPEGASAEDAVVPAKMIFQVAEVIDACLTGQPALKDCFVEAVSDADWASQPPEWMPPGSTSEPAPMQSGSPTPPAAQAPAEESATAVVELRPVAPHDSPTAKGTWNAAANEARLPSPMPVATGRNAYAWIDDAAVDGEEMPKSAGKFIHHNVSSSGVPGAANMAACSAGIGVLNGGRGGTTIPAADREGVYQHLAGHLRQGDQEPPALLAVEGAEAFAALTEQPDPPSGLVVVARPSDPAALVVDRGLPADEMHITLGYYGPADEASPETLAALQDWCAPRGDTAFTASVSGVARMGNDDPQATALLIESSDLAELRSSLEGVAPPDGTHPHFTPHITLGYGIDMPDAPPTSVDMAGVELWVGADRFAGGEALVAALAPPESPPLAWFKDPKLSGPTHAEYLDSGRCFGHLAMWGVCHLSFAPRVCVTAPKGGDYSGFRSGVVVTDDGSQVAVGQLTLGPLHAPANLGFAPSKHHYEDTGCAVADIAIGEDRFGIWFAGALRPDVTNRQLRVLRASDVSGDWRKSTRGQWRVAGALVVNVAGFPVPRTTAYTHNGEQTALVAAGVVSRAPTNVIPIGIADRIARSVGLDHPSRARALRDRVFGKDN